jgi:hypothetical protein
MLVLLQYIWCSRLSAVTMVFITSVSMYIHTDSCINTKISSVVTKHHWQVWEKVMNTIHGLYSFRFFISRPTDLWISILLCLSKELDSILGRHCGYAESLLLLLLFSSTLTGKFWESCSKSLIMSSFHIAVILSFGATLLRLYSVKAKKKKV